MYTKKLVILQEKLKQYSDLCIPRSEKKLIVFMRFPCAAGCWLCLSVLQGGVSEQVLQRFRLQAEPFLLLISDKRTGCYMIDQKTASYCQTVLNYVLRRSWTVTSHIRITCLNKDSPLPLGSEWFRSLTKYTWWFKLLFSICLWKQTKQLYCIKWKKCVTSLFYQCWV